MLKKLPKRYFLITGAFILALFLYIDRACISVSREHISDSLGLNDKQMGWVLSAFALGYALFQTPSGMLIDRFGPRRILSLVVTIWSVFTALTGAAWNFLSLLVIRFLFGAGEAGAFPGLSKSFFNWIPVRERGLAQGIQFSGSRLGAAFALPAIAFLVETIGWRNSFYLQGSVVFAWALVWYFVFRDYPEQHPLVSEEEKNYIVQNRQSRTQTSNPEPLTGKRLFGSRNVWLAMAQYFASNFTFFFCLTWLLPHLKTKFGLDLLEAGFWASAPLLAGAAGNWVSGVVVDSIYRKGHYRLSRQLPAIIGFALIIVGLLGSVYQTSIVASIVFLSLAVFGADMTLSPSWSFCIDIGRNNAGTISGTMNMAGNIGSFITALAFPYLKEWTGSTIPFFVLGAFLALLAIFSWIKMDPEKQV